MRTLAGLSWPEEGNPAFYCVVAEKTKPPEGSLMSATSYLDVIHEFESHSLTSIYEDMRSYKKMEAVYAPNDAKYASYFRDFTRWRREENANVHLRSSTVSSFEAGIVKIKEYVQKKAIILPFDSIIRRQLRVFSKLSLKEEKEFYAVSALTHIIGVFRKKTSSEAPVELSSKLWY